METIAGGKTPGLCLVEAPPAEVVALGISICDATRDGSRIVGNSSLIRFRPSESAANANSVFQFPRTANRILKDCWGRGLKCRPLPQTPSPARRCKNAVTKAEAVSQKTVPA